MPPRRLLAFGITLNALGAVGMLLSVVTGIGLIGIMVCFFLLTSSLGLSGPNATTLALSNTNTAGSASALLGVIQFTIGAVSAPLVGLAGNSSALPMTATIAGFGVATVLAFVLLTRPEPSDAKAQKSPAM